MHTCLVCQHASVEILLDFGSQPISNRFLISQNEHEFKHPHLFGCCLTCGLTQLVNPVSSDEIRPRVEWINYNEPEKHLDQVVEKLCQLPGVTHDSIFCGLSKQEDSTLDRLSKKGFTQITRLNLIKDLGIQESFSGIETVQQYLTPNQSKQIIKNRGPAHVVLARNILEHAHQPLQFMEALRSLIHSDGYVVFEVPDYSQVFSSYDYSFLWEEHVLYFTPESFLRCLELGGFTVKAFEMYACSIENTMVAIAQPNNHTSQISSFNINKNIFEKEMHRIFNYADMFPTRREWYKKILSTYRETGKIALLGASHLACHFINLMEVGDFIDFVVDDHPRKCGMFMPGSRLPIFKSVALEEERIQLCLLSLNQESEKKVLDNKKDFIARGGEFASIFPLSTLALIPYQEHRKTVAV